MNLTQILLLIVFAVWALDLVVGFLLLAGAGVTRAWANWTEARGVRRLHERARS